MLDKIRRDGESRMKKSLNSLAQAFAKIRTGRANPSLLEDIKVDCYGSVMPLKQAANITVEEGRTLVVSPWDPKILQAVEKALLKSDVGITPNTSGGIIRMPMPPLTEENRKQLIKTAKQEAERARVAVRNIRRDLNGNLKNMMKDQTISTDQEKRGQNDVQRLTDTHVEKINSMLEHKEADLLDISQ